MIGIYKITNKINGKSYIGQSIDIERRWRNHKCYYNEPKYENYGYALYSAFRKYGIDNFDFTVIEECDKEQLNEREIYWIEYYDSFENGYNNTKGGDGSLGVRNHYKLSEEDIYEIYELLKCEKNDFYSIANRFGVSYEMIRGINTGEYWHDDKIDYPIAKYKLEDKKTHCIDCGKIITSGCTRCSECNSIYIRKVKRPSKEELLDLIIRYNFIELKSKFGVYDNIIRKWCKQYGLPYKYNDIKQYAERNNIPFRCG